jgi:hypothetical protein
MEMRGQIYSIIVIVLAVPLLLFTAFYISSAQTIGSGAVERIVADQEHQIAESMERDFARAIEISAKRGLLVASDSVIISGIGLENSTAGMIELLTNGTLEGNETYLMINNSLNDWRERILGINVGFETGLEFRGLSIENYNGFNLVLGLNMDVNVSDNLNISRIDRNLDLEELIPVSGIEDPLFPINTGGYVKRLIQEYPFPYYSRKIVTGGGEAGCSGNVSFDPSSPDPGKILVVQDAAGVSGFLGVVSETGSIPSVSCYIVGAAGAVNEINASIGES